MYDNARSPETLWCLSASEPLRPLSLVTRWATYVHPRNLLMWSSWDFSLSPQYQVTLFFYFFLIKSQQQCYLTLIWSQLNPCLNLGRCGAHSNFLSIQPLTSLGLLSWLWVCWSESLDTFDCVIRGISCRSIKDSSKLRIQSHRPFCRCAPAEI